jgi:hypothetical protein
MSLGLARPGCSRCSPTSQPHGSACQRAPARHDYMGTQGAAFKSDHTWHSIPCARTSTRRAREAQRQKLTRRREEIPEASPAGARCVLFNLFPRHRLVPRLATNEDGIINPSLPLLWKTRLSWAIRSGAAPCGGSVRGDASAGVATARFTLQLTLCLVPELRLMAFKPAVLLPKLVGALSYPVPSLIGVLFHITDLPMFQSRRIRRS